MVTARALKVTDDKGNVRAEVAATPGGAEVVLYDDAGTPRVTLASNVQGTGPALSLRGADGRYWVLMGGGEPALKGKVAESEPFLVVQDRQGVPIGQMRKPDPGPPGPKKR